jgi:pimeloyl-ACP methyl ester carboxylesterase
MRRRRPEVYVRHYAAPDEKFRASFAARIDAQPGLHRARHLSRKHPERPQCLLLRLSGRGRSQYDRNWRNYTPFVELLDTLDFLTLRGLHKVGIVGTSRGGMIAMMMAALRPTAMGPVVLNDIGPVIETRGLARIIGYVGRMPVPKTWPDAVNILREMNERAFPSFSDAQWEEIAKDVFDEQKASPELTTGSSPRARHHRSQPTSADLWPQFIALGQVPAFVLRGENSDVLSDDTLKRWSSGIPISAP